MARKADGQQRRMYRSGNSSMVPVPARVRQHLGLGAAGIVYWHLTAYREAVLTPNANRVGGKPYGDAIERELLAARREIDRLRRQLAERPARIYNQGTRDGQAMAQRIGYAFDSRLTAMAAELAAIREHIGLRTWVRPRRSVRGGGARSRAVVSLALPDQLPSPSSPPPAVDLGGDEASGGDAPQASH